MHTKEPSKAFKAYSNIDNTMQQDQDFKQILKSNTRNLEQSSLLENAGHEVVPSSQLGVHEITAAT